MASRSSRKSLLETNLLMVERFRRCLAVQKYAQSTQDHYCRIARKLCEYLGSRTLASVTPMDVGDFLTQSLPLRWSDGYVSDAL